MYSDKWDVKWDSFLWKVGIIMLIQQGGFGNHVPK